MVSEQSARPVIRFRSDTGRLDHKLEVSILSVKLSVLTGGRSGSAATSTFHERIKTTTRTQQLGVNFERLQRQPKPSLTESFAPSFKQRRADLGLAQDGVGAMGS